MTALIHYAIHFLHYFHILIIVKSELFASVVLALLKKRPGCTEEGGFSLRESLSANPIAGRM